jgi:hypothetical protein
MYTKTEEDYRILLQEIKQANISYHTYPLQTEVQPKIALKGIPPTVEIAEIQEELEHNNLHVVNIRQMVRQEKTNTAQISGIHCYIQEWHGAAGRV